MNNSAQDYTRRLYFDQPERMVGYGALEDREHGARLQVARNHKDLLSLWYRALTLYWDAFGGFRTLVFRGDETDKDKLTSWQLQQVLLGMAGGTSKLALDAAYAGYYSQCFGLIRHMLETWVQVAYVDHLPHEAKRWYLDKDGNQVPERSTASMLHRLPKLRPKWKCELVKRNIDKMHEGAHPSGSGIRQVYGEENGPFAFGATYYRPYVLVAMDSGTFANLLLLEETARLAEPPPAWVQELSSLWTDRHEIVGRYASEEGL